MNTAMQKSKRIIYRHSHLFCYKNANNTTTCVLGVDWRETLQGCEISTRHILLHLSHLHPDPHLISLLIGPKHQNLQ